MGRHGGEAGEGGEQPRSEDGLNVGCLMGRAAEGGGPSPTRTPRSSGSVAAEGRRRLRVLDFVLRFGEAADAAGLARELRVIKDVRL
jgi:hypothetical protein